jgi:hypothetical protein
MSKVLRKRRQVGGIAGLEPKAVAWLRGESDDFHRFDVPPPPGAPDRRFDLKEFWLAHRETIVAEHVAERPGTRPTRWWDFEAPERRQRVGGVGSTWQDVYDWDRGIPVRRVWYRLGDLNWHQGMRSRGLTPMDPLDPPKFESEAAYLRRLGLFIAGEEERLSEADFAPEVIDTEIPYWDLPMNRRVGRALPLMRGDDEAN